MEKKDLKKKRNNMELINHFFKEVKLNSLLKLD